MSARLPGTCRGCGARVELSIGEMERDVAGGNQYGPCPGRHRWKLKTAWCVPDTNVEHRCAS